MLLIPVRYFIVPRLGFTKEELEVLDGPVASPFVSGRVALNVREGALMKDNGIRRGITIESACVSARATIEVSRVYGGDRLSIICYKTTGRSEPLVIVNMQMLALHRTDRCSLFLDL